MDNTELVLKIAKVCHTVNREYCRSLGDNNQPHWNDSSEEIKQSAINGVRAHLANRNLTPEESHTLWLKTKLENGWVYGEEKDFDKKTHPCITSYSKLPQEQRSKDYIFRAICLALSE
jgi:hypothetical protein